MSTPGARGAAVPVESYAVSRLAEGGDIEGAARAARALLESGHDDFRLRTYVWLGAFADEGFAALEAAFLAGAGQMADAKCPTRGASAVRERALTWMFRALGTKVAFHRARGDATWRRWMATSAETLERVLVALTMLRAALEATVVGQACSEVAAAFELTLREEIAPRLVPASAAAELISQPSEAATEASETDASETDASETDTSETDTSETEPHQDASLESSESAAGETRCSSEGRENAQGELADGDARQGWPLLGALARKLEAFGALAGTARFEKAGTLAREIEAELAGFDPVRYFPALFAPYYRALHRHRAELAPHLEPPRTAAEHALARFCRLDFEAFVADD